MNRQLSPSPAPVMSERRVSLIGAMLIAIGPVSMALYTPAMPELVKAFATTEAAVKLTLSLYFAGFALTQLICGPLSDGLGRKPVTFAFLSIYLVASLLALVAPSIEYLVVARFFQGVGAAVGLAMSRAIVRDLFTHETSARIMNLMGLILGIAPAVSPTIGGITMELANWHAIFVLMFAAAIAIMIVVHFFMVETVGRDLSRIRPIALLRSWKTLLTSPYFVLSSLVLTGTVGALYTQGTVLAFILVERAGLTPVAFGAAMLAQSGMYIVGGLAARWLMPLLRSGGLMLVGLSCVCVSSILLAVGLRIFDASFISVMGPVGIHAAGIAFIMPAIATAALGPFPHIAGAASSMTGFFQMGGGLLGGTICALIADPVIAMATVIPAMGLMAIISWAIWRTLPVPETGGGG